jgi:negative regulator of sigma E activity
MSEQQDKLSRLLDDFADDEASRLTLDEVEGDVNLQYRMRRYQMIGDALRHELPKQIDTDFSAKVMAQINQIEDTRLSTDGAVPDSGNRQSLWNWSIMKPFAGLAVAASVAIVSITLWQTVSVSPDSGQRPGQVVSVDQQKIERLASQPIQTNAVPASSSLNGGLHWKIDNNAPALQQKLNAYLVNHTEYSNSMQGLIGQARVAGYDAKQ